MNAVADALIPWGFDVSVAQRYAAHERPGAEPARVARVDRGLLEVATATGLRVVTIDPALRGGGPDTSPAIGDWVVVDRSVICAVLDRRSAFTRGDAARLEGQVVAANVDTVFVVHVATETPNLRRLERELVLAFESGAEPVAVLSKADLCDDIDAARARFERGAVGVDVVVTSARSGSGVEELRAYGRPHRTLAFVGASGAGKSTLVNALLGTDTQATGEVRASDSRGRHTTTVRCLFLLGGGGIVVDTPGLRSVGMWRSDDGLVLAFADIEDIARACRFRNCSHAGEPGCAVAAAVAGGSVDAGRVAHYRRLQQELDRLDREAESRARVVPHRQRRRQTPR